MEGYLSSSGSSTKDSMLGAGRRNQTRMAEGWRGQGVEEGGWVWGSWRWAGVSSERSLRMGAVSQPESAASRRLGSRWGAGCVAPLSRLWFLEQVGDGDVLLWCLLTEQLSCMWGAFPGSQVVPLFVSRPLLFSWVSQGDWVSVLWVVRRNSLCALGLSLCVFIFLSVPTPLWCPYTDGCFVPVTAFLAFRRRRAMVSRPRPLVRLILTLWARVSVYPRVALFKKQFLEGFDWETR